MEILLDAIVPEPVDCAEYLKEDSWMASNNANCITHITWNCKQLRFLSIDIEVNQARG